VEEADAHESPTQQHGEIEAVDGGCAVAEFMEISIEDPLPSAGTKALLGDAGVVASLQEEMAKMLEEMTKMRGQLQQGDEEMAKMRRQLQQRDEAHMDLLKELCGTVQTLQKELAEIRQRPEALQERLDTAADQEEERRFDPYLGRNVTRDELFAAYASEERPVGEAYWASLGTTQVESTVKLPEAKPEVHSRGSMGHPRGCGDACKYFRKKGGCRNGADCPCCHLCQWTRVKDVHTRPCPSSFACHVEFKHASAEAPMYIKLI
jgi:hypothetical protein